MQTSAYLSPKYHVIGQVLDLRIRPVYRRFDWSAVYGAPPTDTVEAQVEWSVVDVSTQEVISTHTTAVREMVQCQDEEACVMTALSGAMRRFGTHGPERWAA